MKLTYPHLGALRWAAIFAILRVVVLDAALVLGAIALLANEALLVPALALIISAVILLLVSFALASDLKCVLCRVPFFLPKSCSKNPKVKTFLGSRLLRMSGEILFTHSFRCMYCGERCGCRTSSSDAKTTPKPIRRQPVPQPANQFPSLRQSAAAFASSQQRAALQSSLNHQPPAPHPAVAPTHATAHATACAAPPLAPRTAPPATSHAPVPHDGERDERAMAFALKQAVAAIPENNRQAYKQLWHHNVTGP